MIQFSTESDAGGLHCTCSLNLSFHRKSDCTGCQFHSGYVCSKISSLSGDSSVNVRDCLSSRSAWGLLSMVVWGKKWVNQPHPKYWGKKVMKTHQPNKFQPKIVGPHHLAANQPLVATGIWPPRICRDSQEKKRLNYLGPFLKLLQTNLATLINHHWSYMKLPLTNGWWFHEKITEWLPLTNFDC